MAFVPSLPLRFPPPRQLLTARGLRGSPLLPHPTPAPVTLPLDGGLQRGRRACPTGCPNLPPLSPAAAVGGRAPTTMAARVFDASDFGDRPLASPAAALGVADAAAATRARLVCILLRLINLPRQVQKVCALIEALEAVPPPPVPSADAALAAVAAPLRPLAPSFVPRRPAAGAAASTPAAAPVPPPLSAPPPPTAIAAAPPLSAAEAALHEALDGGTTWRLLFSSTTLGTPSSSVRIRRVGTRFYAPERLAVNFAEWSAFENGVEYTGVLLILSRYTVVTPALAAGRPAVLRLTFLEHQLRPQRDRSPSKSSKIPPASGRLVGALSRMLPVEFFAPDTRLDISHLASTATTETPLLVTRHKGRRFHGVANVWARDPAAAAGGVPSRSSTAAVMDRAVAQLTGRLPPVTARGRLTLSPWPVPTEDEGSL